MSVLLSRYFAFFYPWYLVKVLSDLRKHLKRMIYLSNVVHLEFIITGIVTGTQPVRFNPVMVVDPARTSMPVQTSFVTEGKQINSDEYRNVSTIKSRTTFCFYRVWHLFLFWVVSINV
jgi:hypothetical protein